MRLGREERLEQPIGGIRWNPTAPVGDRGQEEAVTVESRRHGQHAFGGPVGAHGLAGIQKQVQHDLLQLDPIATDAWQTRCQPGVDRHASLDQLAVRQGQDFRRNVVDIERLEAPLVLLQQRAQPGDDLAGAQVVGHDVVKNLAHRGQVGRGSRQQALGGLSIAEDRCKWLVQLVGQRAGELPEDGDPGQVRHFLAPLRDLHVRDLEVGDVASDTLELDHRSPGIADRVIGPLLPAEAAIRPHHLKLVSIAVVVLPDGLDVLEGGGALRLRDEPDEGAADQLLAAAAEIPAVGVIDEGQGGIRQVAADQLPLGLNHVAIALLAPPQRFLGAPPPPRLQQQRDDERRLQHDNRDHGEDLLAVLLPQGQLLEADDRAGR